MIDVRRRSRATASARLGSSRGRDLAPDGRQHRLHQGIAGVDEGPVLLGLGSVVLGDRRHGLVDRAMEADDAVVVEHRDRERVHLEVAQPGAGEVELLGDGRHVDDVVGGRVEVEPVTGDDLLGARAAAGTVERLDHDDVAPGLGQVAGGDEAVVAGADDDVGHPRPRSDDMAFTRRSGRSRDVGGRPVVVVAAVRPGRWSRGRRPGCR